MQSKCTKIQSTFSFFYYPISFSKWSKRCMYISEILELWERIIASSLLNIMSLILSVWLMNWLEVWCFFCTPENWGFGLNLGKNLVEKFGQFGHYIDLWWFGLVRASLTKFFPILNQNYCTWGVRGTFYITWFNISPPESPSLKAWQIFS